MLPKDEEWLKGHAEHPEKFRLPPYLGQGSTLNLRLKSYVCGRLTRWFEVPVGPRELRRVLEAEVALWRRSGYDDACTQRTWRACSGFHFYGAQVRQFFRDQRSAP